MNKLNVNVEANVIVTLPLPSRLRTPCEKRSCVQNRKGKVVDVQRMKIGEKEKGSAAR